MFEFDIFFWFCFFLFRYFSRYCHSYTMCHSFQCGLQFLFFFLFDVNFWPVYIQHSFAYSITFKWKHPISHLHNLFFCFDLTWPPPPPPPITYESMLARILFHYFYYYHHYNWIWFNLIKLNHRNQIIIIITIISINGIESKQTKKIKFMFIFVNLKNQQQQQQQHIRPNSNSNTFFSPISFSIRHTYTNTHKWILQS